MKWTLRIARPSSNPERLAALYGAGLGFQRLGGFTDHAGFDGVMAGPPGAAYHLEFTNCRHHPVRPSPTEEDLLVFYETDRDRWQAACERALAAGFVETVAFNPYWTEHGRTFVDPDGYRLVLCHTGFTPAP